jgi:hypothetical protein
MTGRQLGQAAGLSWAPWVAPTKLKHSDALEKDLRIWLLSKSLISSGKGGTLGPRREVA